MTAVWVIGVPLLSSPLVYLAGRLRNAGRSCALIALLAAWAPFVVAARALGPEGAVTITVGTMALVIDGVSVLVAAIALTLGLMVVLFSGPDIAGEAGEEKYYAMLVAMIGAIIGLGAAADLFNLWVWFEAMAVASYMLVAFHREQPAALEADVKYLVQSAAGSVLVLIGIAGVLAQTGTLSLQEIGRAPATPLVQAAAALFIVGFGVKAAVVPLHTWLPDAHAQAPSGISAMLSGIVIGAALVALLRVLVALGPAGASWGAVLMGIAAFNLLAGNLLALRQTQVKRLLAYSSVSQMGYVVLGLGVAVYAGAPAAASGALFHLTTHALMKGLAFLATGALIYSARPGAALTVADLNGAARRYPLAGFALSVAMLGLAGLPPLAGFMSKWQIFAGVAATREPAAIALVVFAAANSVLSLAYYAPLVNAVYRCEASDVMRDGRAMPAAMTAALVALGVGVIALGVWPGLVRWLTDPAGSAILRALGGGTP